MNQKDRELILVDLCARLSYGVKTKNCKNNFDVPTHLLPDVNGIKLLIVEYNLKPYLRPMSSMTDKEKRQFDDFCVIDEFAWNGNVEIGYKNQAIIMSDAIDWLNSHHFDYRGLIEKGLALEAPKDMY